jgi:two-component system chemotaxis response regulator CheY
MPKAKMPNDPIHTANATSARILVVEPDDAFRTELVTAIEAAGFEVRSLGDPTGLPATLTQFRPQLVFLAERFAQSSGRELALKLRSQGATFSIPIVGLLAEVSVPQALVWLRAGAVDLWSTERAVESVDRLGALLEELKESRVHLGVLKARLVTFARRRRLSGTVVVYPDTPFEGHARFDDGELTFARLGLTEGEAALDEMLSLDDAPARWVPGEVPLALKRVPGGSYKSKILVVEDDDALRALLLKQLAPFGEVHPSPDGIDGLMQATKLAFDVIIADLNLPGLDGWGFLRQVKQHVIARESAVLVLSAHDEMRETLKAARAGARAYVKKTGRAKPLLDTVELLLSPRLRVWESLARKERTLLDVRLLGPVWILRAIAELDLVGTVTTEDPLWRYQVTVAHGQLVAVSAQTGSVTIEGRHALESFLSSTGEGAFVPSDVPHIPTRAPWVFESVEAASESLSSWLSERMRDAVTEPERLIVHPELAGLFSRIASERELRVLTALRQQSRNVASLSDALQMPYDEVELALLELLRRGVLLTEAPVDPSSPSGVLEEEEATVAETPAPRTSK